MGLRDFCIGAVAGATLSIARAPAGITLEEWMSPSATRSSLWRAGALLAVAIGLMAQRRRAADARFPASELALGAAAGFVLHGLVLTDWIVVDSTSGWMLTLIVSLGLMLGLRSKAATADAEKARSVSLAQGLALAVSGAGLALVVTAVNSRLCLFGSGTREDDTIAFGAALVLFAVAVIAFSPLLARKSLTPGWFGLGLAIAAFLSLYSFDFLAGLCLPRTYTEFLRHFDLDSSWRGSIQYDGLLAARVFALPALIAGVALASLRGSSGLGWALLGAAFAAMACESDFWMQSGFSGTTAEQVGRQASERAAMGAVLACAGALLGAFTTRGASWRGRASIALCAGVWIFVARSSDAPSVLPLSPWEAAPPRVEWIRETGEGLLTVELQGGRGRIATLDRRRLTPTLEETQADQLDIRESTEGTDEPSFAIAGFLTPARAAQLRQRDIRMVWAMSPWMRLAPEVEKALFADEGFPEGFKIVHDWTWMASSNDGVVICPAVETASRTLTCLDRSEEGIGEFPVIGWLPAHQNIAQLQWGNRVSPGFSHVENFRIGVGTGVDAKSSTAAGSRLRFGTWSQVLRSLPEREKEARIRAAQRLVRGEPSTAARAAELICKAQAPSSPFESRAQRTELDASAIELLRHSGLSAEPRGFERELDEFLATTLQGKRDIDGLTGFAQPIADRYPTWGVLQRAAAAADWEFMQWAAAARRLGNVVRANPDDLQARLWLAEALLRAGESAASLRTADELLVIQAGHPQALRLRAIAAVLAGDERARDWLEEMLRDHPDDTELVPYRGSGPYPPLPPPLGIPGELGTPEGH
ncbi:MAG TPA: tetratricopeptide repeat protein [Planctomycetota bacterium]|nr:tetratricopeptide repeat protein [Planctomycetota bacterium]